jgi:hypothetical protein
MRLSSREWLLWRSAIKGSYWPTAVDQLSMADRPPPLQKALWP